MKIPSTKTLLCFTLIALIIPLASCMKKENLDDSQDTLVKPEEFQQALIDAYVEDDFYSMKKGESITYLITQTLQDTQHREVRKEFYDVEKKIRDPNNQELIYDIIIGDQDLIKGTEKTTESVKLALPDVEDQSSVAEKVQSLSNRIHASEFVLANLIEKRKPSDEVTTKGAAELLRLFSPRMFYSLFLICGSEENKVCYNFKSQTEMLMAPAAVIASNNCKPGSNCYLRTKKISFDFISTDEKNEKQKVNISVRLTRDTPYLGRVIEFCQKTLVPYGEVGQKVLVEICQTINNYKFGTD